MSQASSSKVPEDLDALCRGALIERRLEAFDNVDIDYLMAPERISIDGALWIGRHLMLNGKSLDAYRTGQKIVQLSSKFTDPAGVKNAS